MFVNNRQHPNGPAIGRAICDEVVAPDVIAVSRSKPNAGTIREP
jgi:hypothetical protein